MEDQTPKIGLKSHPLNMLNTLFIIILIIGGRVSLSSVKYLNFNTLLPSLRPWFFELCQPDDWLENKQYKALKNRFQY